MYVVVWLHAGVLDAKKKKHVNEGAPIQNGAQLCMHDVYKPHLEKRKKQNTP